MPTLNEYKTKITEDNKGNHEKTKKTINDNADNNAKTINTNADNNLNEVDKQYDTANSLITEQYNTQIKDTSDSYESALRTNEVQKLINERAVARRSAELGLTDSGLNRTQQTAVQLSYSNQKGNLEVQRQKAVDTLAAAMRSQIAQNESSRSSAKTEIENSRRTALNENENNRNASIQNADNDFNTFVNSQATELYNAEQEANAKVEAAEIEAETKRIEAQEKAASENKLDYSAANAIKDEILSESEFEVEFEKIDKNSTNSTYEANTARITEIDKQIEELESTGKGTIYFRGKRAKTSASNKQNIKAAKAKIEKLEAEKEKLEAENASILENESHSNYNNYIKDLLKKHYEVYRTINEATLYYLLDYYQIT